jgi:UDP:flavonoid glycosyltransferase YjiC (YdhE family)
MDEQLFWGCRLQNMGLAGKPLPAKIANAKKLAQRIQIVLANTTFSENADRIASEMQKQNGVKKAVNAINKLLEDY